MHAGVDLILHAFQLPDEIVTVRAFPCSVAFVQWSKRLRYTSEKCAFDVLLSLQRVIRTSAQVRRCDADILDKEKLDRHYRMCIGVRCACVSSLMCHGCAQWYALGCG